jgi:hypothetical protein
VGARITWFIFGICRVKKSCRNWRDILVFPSSRSMINSLGVVLAVASHPSENIIASGSLDKDVMLWFSGDEKRLH